MKKFIFLLGLMAFLFTACENEADKTLAQIKQLESKVYSVEDIEMQKENAEKLCDAYYKYYTLNKEDTANIKNLFNKAEIESNLNMDQQAVMTLDTILANYKNSKEIPKVMMFKAFIYDSKIKNYQKAQITYENILKYFPNTEYAVSAEASLNLLGKSDEELIKELKRLNKETEEKLKASSAEK